MISASENLPTPTSGNENELVLRQFLTFHLIALCVATACVIVVILMRNVFISYYRRRMEAIERSKPETAKKSLIQIAVLTGKPVPKQNESDLYLTALKPEFLTEKTWVAAQRAKLFMWGYMCALCGILIFLAVIYFISYSDTLRGLFATPDMSTYPQLQAAWNFIADLLSLNRAPLLLVLLGAWLPFLNDFGSLIKTAPISVHHCLHRRRRHLLLIHWRWPRRSHRRTIQATAGGAEACCVCCCA